jgi:hypothetical protein
MNTSVPAGTENARPFLPARDFDLSRRFYETLGFTKKQRCPGKGFINGRKWYEDGAGIGYRRLG